MTFFDVKAQNGASSRWLEVGRHVGFPPFRSLGCRRARPGRGGKLGARDQCIPSTSGVDQRDKLVHLEEGARRLGNFDAHPALACRIALRERSGRGGLYRARDGGGEQHCADHRERRGGGDLGRSSGRWPLCSTSLTLGPEGRMEDGVISARGPEETDPIAASTNRMVSAESRVRARPEGRRTRRSGPRSCPSVARSADLRELGGAAVRPSPGLV